VELEFDWKDIKERKEVEYVTARFMDRTMELDWR